MMVTPAAPAARGLKRGCAYLDLDDVVKSEAVVPFGAILAVQNRSSEWCDLPELVPFDTLQEMRLRDPARALRRFRYAIQDSGAA